MDVPEALSLNRKPSNACSIVGVGLPEPVSDAVGAVLPELGEGSRLHTFGHWPSPDETHPAHADPSQIDLVLWDLSRGLPGAAELASQHPDIGVAVVGDHAAPGWMSSATSHGAIDAITHDELRAGAAHVLSKLSSMLEYRRHQRRMLIEARTTASQLKSRNDRLESELSRLEAMAWTDPLTGLANRRQLDQRLPQLFAEAVRYDKDLACLMVDLDHFKTVNDRFGHAKGDDVLLLVSRLIASGVRTSDIAARYGGDEFVIIMPQTSARTASRVAQRLVEGLDRALPTIGCVAPGVARCGMSVGVSCLKTSQPIDGEDLISQADSALLAAKTAGKGKIMVWASDGRHAEAPTDIRSEL